MQKRKQYKMKTRITILFIVLATINIQAKTKKYKVILSEAEGKPNILLIYTDDHRYSGVHVLGKQAVITPNIDALANSGIVFNNTYLMGSFSGATCIPSRAMLHTGRQLFKLKGQGQIIPKEHTTIGEAFTNAGYNTYMVGKWHQDNAALARSFNAGGTIQARGLYLIDHFRQPYHKFDKTGEFDKDDIFMIVYDENGKRKNRKPTNDDKRGPTGTEFDGPHSSEIYADCARNFINAYDEKNPFFIYLAFHAPHDPRQAPQEYKDMYPIEEMELTPSYMPQHPFDNGHLYLRDEQLAPWPRTPEIAKQELVDYYAIITHLDAQIGKVIEALKASGKYENTLIVFAGDSGLGVGNHGLLGKQNVYDEDGVHVPFIISGGKAPKHGVQNNAFSYIHDIFPTVCDLAGINTPASVTGKNLKPVIEGDVDGVRDYTYHAYRTFQRAYRKGDYKLIEYVRAPNFNKKTKEEYTTGSRVTQLFNISQDPWETQDLSWFPEYQERVKTMRIEMKEKALELDDKKENVDEKFDFWDYYSVPE